MTTPTLTVTDRVTAGAAWLDEQRPGWWAEDSIDLDELDLTCGCCCVAGQVFGPDGAEREEDGFSFATGLLNDAVLEHRYGFLGDSPEYGPLADAWRELILARRAGTETTR